MLLVYLISGINEDKENAVGIQAATQVLGPRGETESVLAHTGIATDNYSLSKLLNDAYFEVIQHPRGIPIVFVIDAHGTEDGVIINNNSPIEWKELSKYFIPLNKYSNMNLILIIGTCHGAYGLKMVEPGGPAPFLCLFGPKNKIHSYTLQCFYRDFFTALLTNKKLDDILKPLMDVYKNEIYFSTASGMLKEAYKKYYRQGNKHALRLNRIRLRNKIEKNRNLPKKLKKEKLALLSNTPEFNKKIFDKFTSTFFMYEDIPENIERYSYFTYDYIISKADS